MGFDIKAARKEVQEKKEEEIEVETAYKWASRAIACFQLHEETEAIKWLMKGEDYRHEALEHAALAKDGGKTLIAIDEEIEKYRTTVDDDAEVEVEMVSLLEAKRQVRFEKLAQLMKDPEQAAQAIITLVNAIGSSANSINFNFNKSVKDNVAKINPSNLAFKKMQGGALVGQVVNFIKSALRGQDQGFITETLNKVMGKL